VEQGVEREDPRGFGALLEALLVESEGTTVNSNRALDLAVADHDRIAAAIYLRMYGDRIEGRMRCRQCGKAFDVSFRLTVPEAPPGRVQSELVEGPDENGAFVLRNGVRFRLPTARDQLATRQFAPDDARNELLRRCCFDSEISSDDADAVEDAMQAVAPLLSETLKVNCPHCGLPHEEVPFSIQRYLLDALGFERRFLFAEVHQLARAYGWSYRDILALPTADRRVYVGMILAGRASR
jgi:hypothetical protein